MWPVPSNRPQRRTTVEVEACERGQALQSVHVCQHVTMVEFEALQGGYALQTVHIRQRGTTAEVEVRERGQAVQTVHIRQRGTIAEVELSYGRNFAEVRSGLGKIAGVEAIRRDFSD